jgi:hypothetical protein
MELVRSVGRNIDRISSLQCGLLAPECYLHLTVEQDEGLFEIVTMWRWPAPWRHVHVDHTESTVGVFSGDGDGIRVSDQADMSCCRTIQLGKSQAATEIVGRKWS